MFGNILQKGINLKNYIGDYEGDRCGSLFLGIDNTFRFTDNGNEYLKYYLQSSPVFTALKVITDNLVTIQPCLRNKRDGTYIYQDKDKTGVLALLSRPNPFTSQELFYKQLASFFILTGNSYLSQIGNEKKTVELSILRPQNVTIQGNYRDGYPQEYHYQSSNSSELYKRTDKGYKFRSASGNEISQLINFNPNYCNSNLYGISDLAACELEISQYLLASIHNNALLKNSATPSGLVTYKGNEVLTQEDVDSVKEIIRDTFSGASNAGKTAILSGDFNWTQMSQSVRDMDFHNLKSQTELSIYKCLKVPMSYATNEASTFNNKEIAKLDLYDNNIILLRRNIDRFLTDSIMYKYDENLEITFDPASIEALMPRRINNAKEISKMNSFTRDEIRNLLGYENTAGGDIVYQPQNLVAVGTDNNINDDRDSSSAKGRFIKSMKDGGYSDDVINESIKKWLQ